MSFFPSYSLLLFPSSSFFPLSSLLQDAAGLPFHRTPPWALAMSPLRRSWKRPCGAHGSRGGREALGRGEVPPLAPSVFFSLRSRPQSRGAELPPPTCAHADPQAGRFFLHVDGHASPPRLPTSSRRARVATDPPRPPSCGIGRRVMSRGATKGGGTTRGTPPLRASVGSVNALGPAMAPAREGVGRQSSEREIERKEEEGPYCKLQLVVGFLVLKSRTHRQRGGSNAVHVSTKPPNTSRGVKVERY